jgi:predicted transcriptional regulator
MEISQIKSLRKKLGINQKELSQRANVSQSYIAKLESGKIEPSYNKTNRILDILSAEQGKNQLYAKDLMKRKIIYCSPEDKVSQAVKKMKKADISQIPIGDKTRVVGLLTETTILNNIDKKFASTHIKKIMGQVPPIVAPNTPQKIILELLKTFSIVLVSSSGVIEGLISKSDLLEKIDQI